MDPEIIHLLSELKRKAPHLYRHILGLIRALLADMPAKP